MTSLPRHHADFPAPLAEASHRRAQHLARARRTRRRAERAALQTRLLLAPLQ